MVINSETNENNPNRCFEYLVEPETLYNQIIERSSDLVIVDMRGNVKTKTIADGVQTAEYVGAQVEYLRSHIPGAVYIDWTKDIVDTKDSIPAQIANASKFANLLGGLGIGDSTRIVAYDSHPSMQFATRLWWACRFYGNANVRVLNGGWLRWLDLGLPTSSELPTRTPRTFTASPHKEWKVSASDILQILNEGDPKLQNVKIVDARDLEQYSGRIRRGKRGGHIPFAIHLPREAIFEAPGRLLDPAALAEVINAAGITASVDHSTDEQPRIIAYCNGGVAATSVLFALSTLGYSNLANYDGSWNEWNLDDSLPVESS